MKRKLIIPKILLLFALLYGEIVSAQYITTCGRIDPSTGNSSEVAISYDISLCPNGNAGIICTPSVGGNVSFTLTGLNNYNLTTNGCFSITTKGIYTLSFDINGPESCSFYLDPNNMQLPTSPMPTVSTLSNRVLDKTKGVGTIQGSPSVSLTGGATYAIPIALPSGTNGMEPSLSVVYNSQSGAGQMGKGWGISGLSEISRAGEGIMDGVLNVASAKSTWDNFAMDGERLIKIGNEYKTKNESYAKITPEIVNGNIESFTVETKGGQKLEYGKATDSRYTVNGKHVVWKLTKSIDNFGNYIEYKYINMGNEILIDEIKYTGNAQKQPYNIVKFEYKEKIDKNIVYHAETKIKNTFAITRINVFAEGLTHSAYNFRYGFDNIHSYLTEVELIGADGSKLNTTLFKYGDKPTAELIDNNSAMSSNVGSSDFIVGDFDGNGMSDCLVAPYTKKQNNRKEHTGFYIHTNDNLNTTLDLYQSDRIVFPTTERYQVANEIPFGNTLLSQDINGDGMDDIIRANVKETQTTHTDPLSGTQYTITGNTLNSVDLYYSEGKGVVTTPPFQIKPLASCNLVNGIKKYLKPGYSDIEFNLSNDKYVVSGDFDGDSRMDYMTILSDHNKYRIFLTFPALKSYNNEVLSAKSPYLGDFLASSAIYPVDFNGDGKTDILAKDLQYGHVSIFTFIKNIGKTTSYDIIDLCQYDFPQRDIVVGEFNGDGKTDILNLAFTSNACQGAIFLSTGKSFELSGNSIYLYDNANQKDPKIYLGDFDGNGFTDICTVWNEQHSSKIKVFYNSGGISFYEKAYPNILSQSDTHIVGDFNGDGKSELMYKSQNHKNYYTFRFFQDTKNDLLEAVKDGFNRQVSFTYEKATLKGSNNPVYKRNVAPNLTDWPINTVQLPMLLVKETKVLDGLGGIISSTYKYEDAKLHRQGLGFLGFAKVFSENTVLGTKSESQYALLSKKNNLDITHYVSYMAKSISEVGTGADKSVTTTINDPPILVDLGNNRWWMHSDKVSTYNSYTGATSTEKIIKYDAFGNATESESNINNGLEILNTTTRYQQLGNQFLPIENIVKRTRSGQPTYTAVTTRTYGADGELRTEKLFDGSTDCWTQTEFLGYTNDFGQAETKQVTGAAVTARTSKLTYSANGRFVEKTENAKGQVSNVNEYDKVWGKPKIVTPISGISTETEYDGFGRVKTIKVQPKGTSTITYSWKGSTTIPEAPSDYLYEVKTQVPNEPTTIEYFDILERSIRKIISASSMRGLNNSQYIIVTTEYNAKGQAFKTTSPHYDNGPMVITTNTYDSQHRVRTTDVAGVGISKVDYEPQGGGKMLVKATAPPSINNPAGKVSKQITDATGKVIEIIDITDNGETKVKFTYWSHGGQREVKDGNNLLLSQMTYDDAGRQRTLFEPNSGTSAYKYNAYGELIEQNIAQGGLVSFEYNELGQQKKRFGPEGTTINDYYPSGSGASTNALMKVTGFNANNMEYTYDAYGRTKTSKETIKGKPLTTTFDYDNNSRVTSVIYPNSFTINKVYDPIGYLKEVTNGTTKIFEGKNLDALGHYKQYTLGNGITTDIDYDKYGYKRSIVAGTIQNMSFDFELASGNLQSRKDNKRNLTENFVYDKLDRLKTITGPSPMNLTFEDNGNIKSKTGLGSQYTYDATKLHAVRRVEDYPTDLNRGIKNVIYTQYHQASLITEKIKQNGVTRIEKINLEYGADYERRYAKFEATSNHAEYEVYYAGNYEEFKYANGRVVKMCYISGGNGLCAVAIDKGTGSGAELHYTYRDYLGSILAVTDATGNVKLEQSFDAWGRRRSETTWTYALNARPQGWEFFNRGYTGHEHYDVITGGVQLINMNARLYDPINGRMLRWDIVVGAGTQGFNRYSYANNNPLKYTDPSGNFGVMIAAAIGAGIGIITNGISNLQNGEKFFKNAFAAGIKGAVWSTFAFGVGEIASGISAGQALFQAGAHATLGGISSMGDGGSFKSGFLSGAASSIIGGFASKGGDPVLTILAGGLSGGISAELAGGNFWAGTRQGLITAGLNHAAHMAASEIEVVSIKKVLTEGACRSATFSNLMYEAGITLENYSKFIKFGSATETTENGTIYLKKGEDLDFQIMELTHEISNRIKVSEFKQGGYDVRRGNITSNDYARIATGVERFGRVNQIIVASEMNYSFNVSATDNLVNQYKLDNTINLNSKLQFLVGGTASFLYYVNQGNQLRDYYKKYKK